MSDTVKWLDEQCSTCGRQVNSWDKRCSKALGYQTIKCEDCICEEYDITKQEFRETAEYHFGMKPCMGI